MNTIQTFKSHKLAVIDLAVSFLFINFLLWKPVTHMNTAGTDIECEG